MKTSLPHCFRRPWLLKLGGLLLVGYAVVAAAEIHQLRSRLRVADHLWIVVDVPAPLNQAPQGEMIGIGVALGVDEATKMPKIVKVFPGSPAAKTGLAEGDLIREINGAATTGLKLEQCVQMIRGLEGTSVRLEIIPVKEGTSIEVELTRLPFRLPN